MSISYESFESVDIRSGTVVKAEAFSRARNPSFKVWVDFGEKIGILQTSAQITHHYVPETLVGRVVAGCVNLGDKNIAGFTSQFLLLGFADHQGQICLLTVEPMVPNGQKMQ